LPKKRPALERFEEKFIPEPNSGCWLWIGAYGSKRGEYGIFHLADRYDRCLAHRAAWQIYRGSIPTNLQVNHKCNNSYCVNPEHLYLGTQKQNVQDIVTAGGWSDRGRGEKGNHAKLTEDIVRSIRLSTLSLTALGKQHGVTKQTIWAIRGRRTWAHVL
jgi:hypothetical protein